MYKILQTVEAKNDIENIAAYMFYSLKNQKAAIDFLNLCEKQINSLHQIIVLRVLKNLQNWKHLLNKKDEYSL